MERKSHKAVSSGLSTATQYQMSTHHGQKSHYSPATTSLHNNSPSLLSNASSFVGHPLSKSSLRNGQTMAAQTAAKVNAHFNNHSLAALPHPTATATVGSNPVKAGHNSHNSTALAAGAAPAVSGSSTLSHANAAQSHAIAKGSNNHSHHHHHPHNAVTKATTTTTTAAAANNTTNTAAIEHQSQTAAKSAARNKNEEAIRDLRERIPEIENIFDVHSRIGNGTFSTVLLGTLKKERELPDNMKRKFAIKHHIPTSHPDRIMKELQCMAKIGGTDNVVGINCCIRYNESVAFIMPYLQHDRFHDFFSKMDLIEVQNYIKNLLIALRHVHKFNVIHRDVKPSNFLYNRRKRQFLLVDFGLAQQVPSSQYSSSNSLNSGGGNSCVPQLGGNVVGAVTAAAAIAEGKRPREGDDSATVGSAGLRATGGCDVSTGGVGGGGGGVIEAAAKRRCCGGEQTAVPAVANHSGPHARFTNSCSVVSGSPFKMPLKQLNEISNPISGKSGGNSGDAANATAAGNSATPNSALPAACNRTNSGIYEGPLQRQVKSAAILGNSRLQQKLKQQQGSGRSSLNGSNAANASSSNINAEANASAASLASKYNTNRNLNSISGAKCHCYGNPQVCNICLVKKEVHASRAGTPGYRPPEVLLKYADQTTAVDIWASGVIFLSVLSSVYPFFKAPSDYVALAEMVTIFGDKTIRKTAFQLDRLVTLSQKTKPLDLRKLCVRFRNRAKFSSPELLKKYQRADGSCEVCKNCDQFFFNCLCTDSNYSTEPLDNDDPFPPSAYDLLYKLLEVNPHKRISADEALKHPFFSESSKTNNNSITNNNNNNNNNNTVMSNNNNLVSVAAAAAASCGGEPVAVETKKKACL